MKHAKLITLALAGCLLLAGCGSVTGARDEYAERIEAADCNVYPNYDLPESLEEYIDSGKSDVIATAKVVSRGESYKMATAYEIELGEVYKGDAKSGDKLTLITDYSVYDGETYRTSGSTVFHVGSEYLVFLKGVGMDELVPEAGSTDKVWFVNPPPVGAVKISGEYTPKYFYDSYKTVSDLKKVVSELCK